MSTIPVRVSSRKTKGQNKYLESLIDEEVPNPLKRSGKKKEKKEKDRREYSVYCDICGTTDDNYDEENDPYGDMIQCDSCDTWQHINCLLKGSLNDEDKIELYFNEKGQYLCNLCDEDRYPHLREKVEEPHGKDDDDDYDDIPVDVKDDDMLEEDSTKRRHTSSRALSPLTKRSKHSNDTPPPSKSQLTSERLRNNTRTMFTNLFNKYIIPEVIAHDSGYKLPEGSSVPELSSELGRSLENELFESLNMLDNPSYYSERVRMIYSNVKDVKNIELKCHLMKKDVSFQELVRMDQSQLINPDLQSIKKKHDMRVMDQVVFEPLEKTNNTTEDDGRMQSPDDLLIKSRANTKREGSVEPFVNIRIPEIVPHGLTNHARYLTCSKKSLHESWHDSCLDGNNLLAVEGRLSRVKANEYLQTVFSSGRNSIHVYYLKDIKVSGYNEVINWMIDNDKVLGIRPMKPNIKTMYLIGSDGGEYPFIFDDIFPHGLGDGSIPYSEPKLFLLIVTRV